MFHYSTKSAVARYFVAFFKLKLILKIRKHLFLKLLNFSPFCLKMNLKKTVAKNKSEKIFKITKTTILHFWKKIV